MRTMLIIFLFSVLFSFTNCVNKKERNVQPDSDKPNLSPANLAVSNLSAPSLTLHVKGNKIFNERNEEVRLVGVNICSLEWNSRGDNVLASAYEVFANWNCNIVRLPLSQDRWFGAVTDWSTPKPSDNGEQYRNIVDSVIDLAYNFGKYVELDLHWSNAGEWGKNIGQHFMPDENSLEFWLDAAKKYANHPAVLFNLYNEPHSISWEVWRNGGMITEVQNKGKENEKTLVYHSPGHQKIVDEIRALGANNIIITGGIDWGYDLRGIAVNNITGETYALTDTPGGNGIAYESHIYPWKEWDGKNHDDKVLCIADDYPVIIGEIGIDPDGEWGVISRPFWLRGMLNWIDKNELHWIGWCFHTHATPSMISDWQYTPTRHHGEVLKERLLSYSDTNAHLSKIPDKP
jgi:hypothetical protein